MHQVDYFLGHEASDGLFSRPGASGRLFSRPVCPQVDYVLDQGTQVDSSIDQEAPGP